MNRSQLIQEIVSGGFQRYDENNLIDYQSLNRWIVNELKRFGANIMYGNEKTIQVINGKAKLPENFWKLDLALKVTLDKLKVEGDREDFLQSALFYKQRREVDVEWDNASESYQYSNYRCIEETTCLKRSNVTSCYIDPVVLKLTKGFNKEKVSPKCHSFHKRFAPSSRYEINIVGDYINTNFDEGYIYIQYSGLALDDDGEFIIPEVNHNTIEKYLTYYCRQRILEEVITGKDDPDMITMLRYYKEMADNEFIKAQNDASFFGARGWRTAMKKKIKENTAKFEAMLPDR